MDQTKQLWHLEPPQISLTCTVMYNYIMFTLNFLIWANESWLEPPQIYQEPTQIYRTLSIQIGIPSNEWPSVRWMTERRIMARVVDSEVFLSFTTLYITLWVAPTPTRVHAWVGHLDG